MPAAQHVRLRDVLYSYEYDWRNRLTSVTQNSSTVAEYAYDALGRRISKTVDGQMTYYYYDTMGRVIAEYQGIAGSSDIILARTFVYGNGIDEVLAMFNPEEDEEEPPVYEPNVGLLLAEFCESWLCDVNDGCFNGQYDYDDSNMINFKDFAAFASNWTGGLYSPPPEFNDTETRWYYLHDALGSVMAVIGSKYNRPSDREFYLYDVYGMPQGSGQSPSGNPYGFASYRFDNETYLYYLRARYYDPYVGRFTSLDPLGVVPNAMKPNMWKPLKQYSDGTNLYEYVKGSPMLYVDPSGLACYFIMWHILDIDIESVSGTHCMPFTDAILPVIANTFGPGTAGFSADATCGKCEHCDWWSPTIGTFNLETTALDVPFPKLGRNCKLKITGKGEFEMFLQFGFCKKD